MTGTEFIKDVLNKFVDVVAWPVFVTIVVVAFIYIAFLFITSKGEPGKIDQARKALIWGIIGVGVGVLAFSIQKTITTFLGL